MSSNEIAYALALVKTTPGSKAKKALLHQLRWDHPEESARIMRAVFDVNTTYGFNKKIPEPTAPTTPAGRRFRAREFSPVTWALLDQLASRKLSGDAAKKAVAQELGLLSAPSRELLVAILQQNLRGGYGIDVVVEVWGPIVETFDVCLAQEWRAEKHRIAPSKEEFDPKKHISYYPVWVDVKYDGLRGFRFHNTPLLVSRKKLPLSCPDSLQELMTQFLDAVLAYVGPGQVDELILDCEIVSVDGQFKDAMSNARASKKGAAEGSLMIRVIDIISTDEISAGRSFQPHKERRAWLERMLADPSFDEFFPLIQLTDGKECASEDEVEDYYLHIKEVLELEGVIVKPREGHWETKRSYYWLKCKGLISVKGRIVRYEMSDPLSKNAGMVGSVWVSHSGPKGDQESKAAGMTDEMRQFVTDNMDELINEQIELMAHEYTPDGCLRHPRIKAIRSDRE